MTVRPILLWPDPRLSRVCAPVGQAAPPQGLIADLFETMYDAPGRGLAAPQIGVMTRVFVMDAGWKTGERTPRVCIDPEVLWSSEALASGDEGCLSIPGVLAHVSRPAVIDLGYRDAEGDRQEVRLDGFEAACAQHELDHLDGLVTFDRLAPDARAALEAAYGGAA